MNNVDPSEYGARQAFKWFAVLALVAVVIFGLIVWAVLSWVL